MIGRPRERSERHPLRAHPAQGLPYSAIDRLGRIVGRGFCAEIFTPEILAARVERVTSWVQDFAPKPVEQLRVVDLGCYEGAMALALGGLGAEVVGIEGRAELIGKAEERREGLGLSRVNFVQDDVRNFSVASHGRFDVVLCLGILYHLPAADVFRFAARIAEACDAFAIIETQVALRAKREVSNDGVAYRGREYEEDPVHPGAAIDSQPSFWPTKPSLISLLEQAGFSSIAEAASPRIPKLDAYRDHVVLIATSRKGAAVTDIAASA